MKEHMIKKLFSKYTTTALVLFLLSLVPLHTQAAIFDVEAKGIYGGFWRDLYKFGPVVIDTIGADLGVFVADDTKVGFSFTTIVGLLSGDDEDDVFEALGGSYGTPDSYGGVLSALEPAEFSYSTAALKLENLLYDGSIFGVSTTGNLGQGVFAQGKLVNDSESEEEEYQSFAHTYATLGVAVIIKITKNFRMSFGVAQRKDLNAGDKGRPEGFENLDSVSIYNHVYLVKF